MEFLRRSPSRPLPEVIAICLLAACALQIFEAMLPKIPLFPWLRLGLSHLILLPFLLRYGVLAGLGLLMARNGITLIYGGQVFTSFLISSAAGIASMGVLAWPVSYLYHRGVLGLAGASVLLAAGFNLAQLWVVNFVFIQNMSFFFQLGPLLIWSGISGVFIAWMIYRGQNAIAACLLPGEELFPEPGAHKARSVSSEIKWKPFWIWLTLFAALTVVPITSFQILGVFLGGFALRGKYLKLLLYAWPYFLFILWLHLLKSDGVYIWKNWITDKGLEQFLLYSFRTAALILIGKKISLLLVGWSPQKLKGPWAEGVSRALPVLPGLFGLTFAWAGRWLRDKRALLRQGPLLALVGEIKNALREEGEPQP